MPTFWQKLQSLFFPVRIRKSSGTVNPVLELFYFHGRYMLGTPDAVYSDGDRYRPLVAAFGGSALRPHLAAIRDVLMLGTGLASAVHVMRRYGHRPRFTLVDIDPVVLDWAMEFLPRELASLITPICDNAFQFVEKDKAMYDLVVVDIFIGRDVPEPATSAEFLQQCKARLRPGGRLVLNYMINRKGEEEKAKAALSAAFESVKEISFGINKVYIAR